MRKKLFILFLMAILISSNLFAQVWNGPVEAQTNKYLNIGTDGSVTYTLDDTFSSGYVKFANFRDNSWDASYNIGLDRTKSFWFAGEFIPSFSSDIVPTDNRAYNLAYAYFSLYVQYYADPIPNNNKFVFGFYEKSGSDWNAMYLNYNFNAGETMRYVARMKTSIIIDGWNYISEPKEIPIPIYKREYVLTLWIKGAGTIKRVDKTIKKDPISLNAFSSYWIGSGSHGNSYDQIGGKRDSFFGKINRSLIGQSYITDTQAESYINNGNSSIPTTGIIFDSFNMNRKITIPLFQWEVLNTAKNKDLKTTRTTGSGKWIGIHEVLESRVTDNDDPHENSIFYLAADDLSQSDLRRRYLSFTAFAYSQSNSLYNGRFYFYIWLKGITSSGVSLPFKYIGLSPSFVDGTSGIYITKNINLGVNSYKSFCVDMLSAYQELEPSASQVEVRYFIVRGDCSLSDIIMDDSAFPSGVTSLKTLQNNDTLQENIKLPEELSFQIYPNPSIEETSITFDLPEADHVDISIYNTKGEKIKQLLKQSLSEGFHSINLNTKSEGITPGLYFINLKTKNKKTVKKLLVQ